MINKDYQRFMSKVEYAGCWNWLGGKNNFGYGSFWLNGKDRLAHRVSYEHFKKPIDSEMTIDHACRNTSCVNPEHLREMSMKENILIGTSPSALNKVKTHCKNGHEFTKDNLVPSARARMCKVCHNSYNREYSRKNWKKYQQQSTPIVAV